MKKVTLRAASERAVMQALEFYIHEKQTALSNKIEAIPYSEKRIIKTIN